MMGGGSKLKNTRKISKKDFVKIVHFEIFQIKNIGKRVTLFY
jgi:hypothetical protein